MGRAIRATAVDRDDVFISMFVPPHKVVLDCSCGLNAASKAFHGGYNNVLTAVNKSFEQLGFGMCADSSMG